MNPIRTVVSALCILVGASLIALWAVSGVVVGAVEDGTAVHGIAERALADDAVSEAVAAAIADGALDALADAGLDPERLGLDAALRALVEREASSPEFQAALLDQIDDARAQFAAQVTEEDRAPAPLVIDVDASAYVNDKVEDIPVVGSRAPEVSLAPIPVEVMDAQSFEDVRTGYRYAELAQRWGLWVGIGLIVLGLVVTHRTRWFVAKAGLAVGAVAGALWLVLQWWGVDGIARALPGGEGGAAGSALLRIVTEDSVAVLSERLGTVCVVASAIGAVFLAFALVTRRRT